MQKILVTGGAGFIGSHVVDFLVDQGKQVVIADNLSTGQRDHVSRDHRVRFIEVDITQEDKLKELFEQHHDIEGVVHLAAQSKVGPSLEKPQIDADINIMGTIHLLEMARKHGVQNFIYASSAAVYGNIQTLPIIEDMSIEPLSPYGVSKYAGEQYVQAYGRLYDINVTVLRFANVYGPRQSAATEAGVITIFIEQLLKGERPVIFGNGKQTRDFVYVQDVARAVVTCLLDDHSQTPAEDREESRQTPATDQTSVVDHEDSSSEANHKNIQHTPAVYDDTSTHISPVYHVSTGQETSIEELLQEMCNILDVAYDPHFTEKRPGDIEKSYLDHSRLTTDYKWEPKTAITEGLIETIEYYQHFSTKFDP